MPRSSPSSSSEGPGFARVGELRTCVFSTNAIPCCPVQTRTGLNAATDMTGFRFALTALDEISRFFSTDFHASQRCGGHLFQCATPSQCVAILLPVLRRARLRRGALVPPHVCGFRGGRDAGHLSPLLRALRRSDGAQVLTLPMAVYVDGNCLMGPCRGRVDAEMHSFQAWALDVSPSHRHALRLVPRL